MLDLCAGLERGGCHVRLNGFLACVGLLSMVFAVDPARADCFEGIGCTDSDWYDIDDLEALSCENLWYVRNRIYDENGFCFKTARARSQFDNSNCWVNDQANVKLSQVERHNVNEIVEAESENGCR